MQASRPTPTLRHSTCAHCGDQCGSDAVSDGALTFCCSGCRSVYEILRTHDLCAYYDLDAHPGTSMKGAGDEEFVALDDPAVVRLFVEFDSGRTRRLRFEIPSMHCASCVWLLEQLDRLDTGIQRSEVDLMRKSIRVDIDPTKTSARGVASLLTSLGYKPLIRVEGSTGASSALRTIYLRLGVAGFAMGNVMMFSIARYLAGPAGMSASLSTLFDILSVLLSIPVLVYSSAPWWQAAWGALRRRTINLEVPVALGIATLFVRSVTDIAMGQSEGFLDSFTGLVFFLLIGRLFQQKAFDAVSFDRTYRSFFPLSVRVERRNAEHVVSVDNVEVGDTMLVRNGEVIPCDAVLISPIGYVDYSFVTGESIPVECTEGALVYAGGRVVGGRVRLTATRTVSHGYLASLWDRAGGRKQRTTLLDLATTFGRVFTVAAVGIAVIGGLVWLPDLAMSLQVLTAVLIIACPCALTLSAPVTLGTAMAILGRRGTYVKNVGVLLDLASIDTVIIDKTGTLTAAHHDVAWNGADLAPSQRTCVVTLASHSTHPVSRSIAASMHGSMSMATHVEETAGQGIAGLVDGSLVRIGSAPYVGLEQTTMDAAAWVSIDGHVIGAFVLQPRLREGVTEMLRALMARMRVVLLSGDSERDRSLFAPFFAEHDMRFGATPHDKVEHVRALRSQGRHTVMIGDGLNDAAAMAEADAAIAVTDETATLVPACDVIMQAGQLVTLPSLIAYTRRVKQVIWWNLGISMAYNVLGLTLALMGVLSPVIVAVLMPVSSLTVIGVSVFGARWFGRRNAWA